MLEALKIGYSLVDTARIYANEKGVGAAVRESAVPRQDIFVTTKLWNSDHGYQSTLEAFDKSLARLKLDYVDLYLVHWPGGGQLPETWRAMEAIYKSDRAKSIGVSNYETSHLADMLNYAQILPTVNQIEFHPFIYENQKEVLSFCQKHGIVVEAYSPLVRGHGHTHPSLLSIAHKLGKTPAQVMLRWAVEHGTVPIPKSSHPERMKENIDIFDFKLSALDITTINSLSSF